MHRRLAKAKQGESATKSLNISKSMEVALSQFQNHSRANSAFALAEVVVAVVLISVAFISLYLGVSSSFAITQASRENLRATQIMLERIEGLRLYNWNQLLYSNMIPSTFVAYYYPGASEEESRGIAYDGTIEIGPADMNPAATYEDRMRAITVTVTWTNGGGAGRLARSRSMTTYAARDGIQNYVINH